MKITEIKSHEFTATTRRMSSKYGYSAYPIEMLQSEPRETSVQIQELVTDTGTSGYWMGPPLIPWLNQLVLGEDPMNREWLWQQSRGNSDLDMLLWDFAGRYFETPVHKLLGGYRDKIKCYASSFPNMGSPEVFADHAEECVKKGYLAYKIHAYMY